MDSSRQEVIVMEYISCDKCKLDPNLQLSLTHSLVHYVQHQHLSWLMSHDNAVNLTVHYCYLRSYVATPVYSDLPFAYFRGIPKVRVRTVEISQSERLGAILTVRDGFTMCEERRVLL